jgi:uncharacterized membrane protein
MLRIALLFVTAVLISLTAGRAFWVLVGESPLGIAGTTYVDFFQQLDKRIAIPMAVIGILGPTLAGVCAVVYRANRCMFFFLITAFGFGVVAVLVTVLVNVPINNQIAGWSPAALPMGYEDILRRWWNWHILRTIANVGAMCSVFAALLAKGRESLVEAA